MLATPIELPDEDTFVPPDEWRKKTYPRRDRPSHTSRTPSPPLPDAVQRTRTYETRCGVEIGWVLGDARSDAFLVQALRDHQGEAPNPLGAALLASICRTSADYAVVADAWVEEHGLVFAAEASVELFGCYRRWDGTHAKPTSSWLTRTEAQAEGDWSPTGGRRDALDRIRALLAVTDDATYRRAVDALTLRRGRTGPRIAVGYLVPTETRWTDECVERDAAAVRDDAMLGDLIMCSASEPAHLEWLRGHPVSGWRVWRTELIATMTSGAGADLAWLFDQELTRGAFHDAHTVKLLTAALGELPNDEAFAVLLAHGDDKYAQPPLSAAARRHPVRALRLLAAASTGTGKAAATARELLTTHITSRHELAEAVLPDLAPELAAVVRPLVAATRTVATAPPEALPPVLAAPPWTRSRVRPKPVVVPGLVPDDIRRAVWLTGERERWAATPTWYAGATPAPIDESVAKLRAGSLEPNIAHILFLNGPTERLTDVIPQWRPRMRRVEAETLHPIVSKYEAAAVDAVVHVVRDHPNALGSLVPLASLDCARIMADALTRRKSGRDTARSWFTRHHADAARMLIPDAVGPVGPARQAAVTALLSIASTQGPDAVRTAAAGHGAEAAAAVDALLTADPLELALPARLPAVPSWLEPTALPQLRLRDRGDALGADAVRHALTMLAISKPGAVYAGVDRLKDACTPESLAEFVWALFAMWRLSGMPSKDSWALSALAWLGDDETVRRLDPVIRAWPGEGAHKRAVDGLDVLAAFGSEVALMRLHGIAQRVKFKALRTRAQDKIAEVAAELRLTPDQLADRLVPELGLDANGTTVIDYGSRTFTIGFDEQLKPYVLDADGKRRKDLPAPGARDDAELAPAERKRYAALKKDIRAAAADTLRRLESAMATGRTWTSAEFRDLFVAHPLLVHVVRRLVWLAETDGHTTAFRVAEDRTYADSADDEYRLPDNATVRLAHPLHLADDLDTWSELFADYELPQPFPQLGRPVFTLTENERTDHRLRRFENLTVPTGKVLGLQHRGWERGVPQDAGVERWISRRLSVDTYLVIALEYGIPAGIANEFPSQTLRTVWLANHPGDYIPSDDHPLRFADLPPVLAGEILADLADLAEDRAN
ncbi:DUF4132 domain-containing protein [Embleya sp. NBC_00896]|uniref:DUF4132 domain-containing protein n=1 Tax=Embleya sp. NBC_00896 TaxID=2975961 RepID=UPI00386B4B71|nr:DUF4132 domain-containing protein [Embleya sp. NBC_00896]